jgi:hypothetical protein
MDLSRGLGDVYKRQGVSSFLLNLRMVFLSNSLDYQATTLQY